MEAVIAVDTLVKEVVVVGKKERREVAQSCPTLCNSMGYSLSGSSIHGIFQARVLEWVAISFSRGSSRPREDRTQVFHIAGRCLVGKEVVEMEVMVKVWGGEVEVMVRLVVVELLRLVIERVMVGKLQWALLRSILQRSYH